jgi:hypothetical protein
VDVEQRIKQMRDEELYSLLEEGYRANTAESVALAREFDAADIEGWDDCQAPRNVPGAPRGLEPAPPGRFAAAK